MASPKASLAVPLAAIAVASVALLLASVLFQRGQTASGSLVVIALVAGGTAGGVALRTLRQSRRDLDLAINAARHDLHKIEHILEMAGRMSKMGAWSVEFPEQRILWSEEVYRIHDVPSDFNPNLDAAYAFYPPASREQIETAFRECATHGTPYDLELEFLSGKGRRLWIRTIGEAEYDDGALKRIIGTFQDITEEREAAGALKQSREFLQLALSSAEMSISDWHIPSGRILFDENWARILGYRLDEVQQTLAFWDSLIPDEDQPAIMEAQNRCFSGVAPLFDVIYRMRGKNGEYHWVLERSKIVERDGAGDPVRLSGILLDVTARKQTEEELREAKARLEQTVHTEKELTRTARAAERAKSEFLAVMSHEIRTPMNGVLGFADLLAQTPLDGSQLDFIHTIQRSGTALLRIIDDILDYSRLEAGRLKIEDAEFSLRQLLQNVEGLMSPAAHQKGVQLEIKIAETIPDRLIGASDRIQQVLVNLTGNAIKFTPTHGNVVIGCRQAGPGVCDFFVQDTGIGIPASQIAQIFEPFVQADASLTRRYGGTGLGLAISRRFVELMNGSLSVESTPEKGSRFHFSIPLAAAEDQTARQEELESSPLQKNFASLHPLNILVAEDDAVNRKLMVKILRRLGYSTLIAHNGREAVAIFQTQRPNCILMDLHMPELDGIAATRAIRAFEQNGHRTFIAALTADVLPEERARCRTAGMDDYLTKPLRQETLARTLAKASITAAQTASDNPANASNPPANP